MHSSGSIQDFVDRYLDAEDEDLKSRLAALLGSAGQSIGAWNQEVIPRLIERFQAELDEQPDGSQPSVETGKLGQYLLRWNTLGANAALNNRLSEAEALFRTLLSVLRRAQPRLGRLHKGTPLHQLGWLRLFTDQEAATPYILAALIEDFVSDPKGFTGGPAAQVCLNVLGHDPSLFDEVRGFVEAEVPGPEPIPALARSDPELLSLVHSMNDTPGSELLRISLHFDPAIGDLLQDAAK